VRADRVGRAVEKAERALVEVWAARAVVMEETGRAAWEARVVVEAAEEWVQIYSY